MRHEKRLYYPTVGVANEVLWVNSHLEVPFNLEVGKPIELGVMVVNPQTASLDSNLYLGVDSIHGRSGYLGRHPVCDDTGVMYRDWDLKGVGYIGRIMVSSQDRDYGTMSQAQIKTVVFKDNYSTYGIGTLSKARREILITEDIHQQGARTNRIAALIGLHKIATPSGALISVDTAKKTGLIHPNAIPVLSLRTYRIRERLEYPTENARYAVWDAKGCAEEELDRDLSWQDFMEWYMTNLGGTMGVINRTYWHGAADSHNLTMGAEVVDFGLDYGDEQDSKKIINDPESSTRVWFDKRQVSESSREMIGVIRLFVGDDELQVPSWEPGTDFMDFLDEGYSLAYQTGQIQNWEELSSRLRGSRLQEHRRLAEERLKAFSRISDTQPTRLRSILSRLRIG